MFLTTKIKLATETKDSTTHLDKFFQFIILDKLDKNRCNVSIYNAIAFRNKTNDDSLIIEFIDEKNNQISNVIFKDHSEFYEKTDILSQFWGPDSKFSANTVQLVKDFLDNEIDSAEKNLLHQAFKKNTSKGALGVTESKASINNIIISPSKAECVGNEIVLKCHFGENFQNCKSHVANGYWFKVEFEMDLNTSPNGFAIKSQLVFSDNTKFVSPDFKIYFQTGKKYDLKRSKIIVNSDNQDIPGEIVKLFSQSKITYFEEWAEQGIYNSSLFKINTGTIAENSINDKGLKSISVSSELEDLELPRRREINLLIISIIFSLLASFGFDKTRQTETDGMFAKIFPSWEIISIDVLWFFVCFGVLVTYYFIKESKCGYIFKCIYLIPISLWFTSYFTFNGVFLTEQLKHLPDFINYSFLYKINLCVIIYLSLCCILIKYFRSNVRPNQKDEYFLINLIKKIIGA